jgi:hypothetical protein
MITMENAIEIAERDNNMPQAIHEKIKMNFKASGKEGILSYIELKSPVVGEVTIEGVNYFEITFLKGDISWQQLSSDLRKVEVFYDGVINDDSTAKCLVNKQNGDFKYTGSCDIGLENK